ncbi:DUF4158 domain-containing protein [Streptosporangium amethystogenes]|uniref:DUF4158 domain-containing protein n=1 Tax=Streptosporangium amethystogenes TaxID=2002 RepID=UPI0037A8A554
MAGDDPPDNGERESPGRLVRQEASGPDQVAAYATFVKVPSPTDSETFFFLDRADRDLIALRRADSHRLGLAVQITTVRYKGLFVDLLEGLGA